MPVISLFKFFICTKKPSNPFIFVILSKDVYLNLKRQSDGSIDDTWESTGKKTRTIRILLIKKKLKFNIHSG